MTKYLVVRGGGTPEAVDAYLYGGNDRTLTVVAGGRFKCVVTCNASGGFGAGPQAARLASGLYGAQVWDSFDEALEAFNGKG